MQNFTQNYTQAAPRTALYIRVSTEEQALHGLSLDAQEAALTEWARKNNCKIAGTYIDGGKTARKSIKSRVELQRLLSDVESNKIDLIIFTKLDRWFRNIKDYYKVQEILDAHNVHWRTIYEDYDTSTANGRLHINIMLSIAQDEADRTSERIKAVFQNKLERGEGTCPNLPIGYKLENSRIVINEEKAPLARDIFTHYLAHHSQRGTQKAMRDLHGAYLHHYTIKSMLTNPIYIGTYRGRPNFCEPLISVEDFNEVQRIIKDKNVKQGTSSYDFIFTGMLTCAECGHKMAGNAQIRRYADGTRRYYICYRCNEHYGTGKCNHNHAINEKTIEEYLVTHIKNEIDDYIYTFEVNEKTRKKPKVDKAKIKRKLDRLKELYVNDLIDMDTYKKDYEDLTAKLTDPDPEPTNIEPLKEFKNGNFLEIYNTLDNESKRLTWRTIISRLIITNENNITIQFTN